MKITVYWHFTSRRGSATCEILALIVCGWHGAHCRYHSLDARINVVKVKSTPRPRCNKK